MQPKTSQTQIDVSYLVRELIKNIWIIALCGWIGCLWGFMIAGYLGTHTYTSNAYMIMRNKENPEKFLDDGTIKKVAAQFQKTFTSTVMKTTIQDIMKEKELDGKLNVTVAGGTNILVVSATADRPITAYQIVKTAIENYTSVTDYVINDYYLEEIKSPAIPYASSGNFGYMKIALLGGLAGAAACIAWILLINLLKDDIKNEGQIEELLDTERFATLYYEKKKKNRGKKGILIRDPYTSFLYKENVKKMATKLDYTAQKEQLKVLLVTSVEENEGKSTVAANLALALADMNKNVLLIDADLRSPAMYKLFEKNLAQRQEIGNYLDGSQPLQTALTKESKNGLYYLFGSAAYQDSDMMLRSDKMEQLLTITRKQWDYVILDTSPLSVNNDAEILCKYADGALFVVRQGYARVPVINDGLDSLRANHVKVLGCVYNAVQTRWIPKSTEYGYYSGYYGYRYGSYYGRYGYGRYAKKEKQGEGK